ncbi:RagB/SusD family nutrient uptake outer membrane protein [Sphingobacterium shayense]|uniref:RagB/SusD family nutrient uptake outer membrane protein n=1 Tax=Sphingobacterium shayense TaxID=626343 RepID=UPI001557A84C|nr:RagB/SusD family nutrient uptake outer membrane protein [Sphingobacterium shayense]NQD71054.1 RagB/SusD family nutrient uptake outer membrane protein [Sphingobacterium shayense]
MIKNIKSIIGISALSAVLLSSCDLERLPLDGPSAETFPANMQEAELGLLGAYKSLTLLDASSTPIWHVMDNITDIGYARPGNNYTSPITSSITTDNALATKPWGAHYKTIGRVHDVLDKLAEIQQTMSEADYKRIDGELRFIRAYCYSQLIELYGDVPLLTTSLQLGEDLPARTSKQEVEQFIIDEITAIAENLPVSQTNIKSSRASRIAAYMLKARVALYSKQYKLAAETAKIAIDLSDGVHSLTAFDSSIEYANKNHDAGEPEVSNIFGHQGFSSSKEWIWIAEYNGSISDNVHNQLYYMSSRLGKGVCYWGPTQNLMDSFQDIEGNYITESSIYEPQKPFENRDPRLDLYTVRPHSRFMGFQFEPNSSFPKVNNYWPMINGSASEPTAQTNADATNAYRSFSGYLWRKHTDLTDFQTTSVSGFSDLDIGIFRYAELLLIYAEAKIEDNSIDGSVYDAINQIRQRAMMPEIPQGLSQQELRTALRYERKIELANDGLRWYDLRRWGIAQDVMNGYIYLNRLANDWSATAVIRVDENANPVYNHDIAIKSFGTQEVVFKTNKDEYWPISSQEIDANKNLKQNPGY